MAGQYPGPFCQEIGLQSVDLLSNNIEPKPAGTLKHGHIIELKKLADTSKLPLTWVINWLNKIDKHTHELKHSTLSVRIKRITENNKKLIHKKKVAGFKSSHEYQDSPFLTSPNPAPVKSKSKNIVNEICPKEFGKEIHTTNVKNNSPIRSPNKREELNCSESAECGKKPKVEEIKTRNVLKHEIKKQQKVIDILKILVTTERENLEHLKRTKGHFSVRNVTKRDQLAIKNRKLLRDANATVAKQNIKIEKLVDSNLKLAHENEKLKNDSFNEQMKNNILKNEIYVDNLLVENEKLRLRVNEKVSEKQNATKSVRYFKKRVNKLRNEMQKNNHAKSMKNAIREKDEEICQLQFLNEKLNAELEEKYQTKNVNGSFNDSIRLCVIELTALEVAVEKISPVIQVVSNHLFSRVINDADLPTSSTVQSIVDEGHFLAKTYISSVIDASESFGLSRDGTTRKKQKIVDTSVTVDTGEVMSLGFTRIAHETAKTINKVTQNNFEELAQLNKSVCSDSTENSEYYIRNSLQKLSFSMSDRASNEKLADKLLDEWREQVLQNCENGHQVKIKHFHCMAHVLLGFHKYACSEMKSVEAKLVEDKGPLGRDSLPAFKFWRQSGTVVERVVRTASETFGPAGDYLGLRDRWDAYCCKNGVKSVLGNYRDNRFNGIFQTSAEILVHVDEMLDVLNTVKNPNRKLQAVKADLQCETIRTLLQCFGLFYVKVTGPYWNLVTSNSVPYLLLYNPIQAITAYLKSCTERPSILLNPEGHWASTDIHCVADIPYRKRFIETVFKVNEETEQVLYKMIITVSTAMLKCMEKQLADFLPGGVFSEDPSPEDLKRTTYAHSTNLGCEHHFGDLDSSQKRRPNASMHHHSSIQLLKRNRKQMMRWLQEMSETDKHAILKQARQGGRHLRKMHIQAEKEVLEEIHNDMLSEKNRKPTKKRKLNEQIDCDPPDDTFETLFPTSENFQPNEYVVVAYQDQWYPGCIQQVSGSEIIVNFMSPTRKPGHFLWPSRKDIQTVCNEFIIKRNFVPECLNSGRLWKIPDFQGIEQLYKKYCYVYF